MFDLFPLAKVGIFAISGLQKLIFFGLKYAKTICLKAGFVKSAPYWYRVWIESVNLPRFSIILVIGIMIRQCSILFGCLALGELIVYLTGIKLPSSIIGMLLLTLFLQLGWIKLEWVQGLTDFLVANLGFFFVPSGVALMLYFDIIQAQFWPIVIATLVSTVLVLIVTGWVHQLVRKYGFFRK